MLRSFFMQAIDADRAKVVVLYTTSSSRYRSQYEELNREYRGQVLFQSEADFRSQVLELLREASRSGTAGRGTAAARAPWRRGAHQGPDLSALHPHVLFLVDDALFVRPIRLAVAIQALDSCPQALGFSFRLGRNTRHCYVLGREQTLPRFESQAHSVLKFRWTDGDGDFAYPLELSSSLYRAPAMVSLCRKLRFRDPNTLESQMSLNARGFAPDAPFLLCWEASAAFSAPINRVQAVFQNRVGERDEYSLARMGDTFDRGQRIDLAALDGFVPSACHQEIDLTYTERRSQHAK